jgi:hypothetical protein
VHSGDARVAQEGELPEEDLAELYYTLLPVDRRDSVERNLDRPRLYA